MTKLKNKHWDTCGAQRSHNRMRTARPPLFKVLSLGVLRATG